MVSAPDGGHLQRPECSLLWDIRDVSPLPGEQEHRQSGEVCPVLSLLSQERGSEGQMS